MAIAHAASGQLIDVQPLAGQFSEARTVALFKSTGLEVIRLVMPAGKTTPAHGIKSEVTVHCLEGVVELIAHGQTQRLTAGQLVWLEGGVEHALTALENASLLLTIALKK